MEHAVSSHKVTCNQLQCSVSRTVTLQVPKPPQVVEIVWLGQHLLHVPRVATLHRHLPRALTQQCANTAGVLGTTSTSSNSW